MSLTNIKLKSQSERGFTIVELLIVVVVIAILAAITIVSYNGITNRANQSASKSTAGSVQKKVELYASEIGNYPVALTDLTNATTDKPYYIPSTSFTGTSGSENPTSENGKNTVKVQACRNVSSGANSATNVTGTLITYWAYGATGNSGGYLTIALGSNCDTTANLANL